MARRPASPNPPAPKILASGLEVHALQLFEGLTDRALSTVLTQEPVSFMDGATICTEGHSADCFFVILHGRVAVLSEGELIVTRGPGDVVGEQAFIEGGARTATLKAQGMVRLLSIPHAVYDQLLSGPAFARNMLRVLSTKLSESTVERRVRFRSERLLFAEFGAHVAPAVRDLLLSRGECYGDPRRVDAVVLFADIRDFTTRSSRLRPRSLAKDLTAYLDAMVDVIHSKSGLVDKFVGDAVMAVWGFDRKDKDIAVKSFDCAREMVAVAHQHRLGGMPIEIGIGLNAGEVFMGNVGTQGKRQFTVLGSTVNLASRFEAATKVLQAPVAIGKALADRLPPKIVSGLKRHGKVPIRHARPQTVFTWQPERKDGGRRR